MRGLTRAVQGCVGLCRAVRLCRAVQGCGVEQGCAGLCKAVRLCKAMGLSRAVQGCSTMQGCGAVQGRAGPCRAVGLWGRLQLPAHHLRKANCRVTLCTNGPIDRKKTKKIPLNVDLVTYLKIWIHGGRDILKKRK